MASHYVSINVDYTSSCWGEDSSLSKKWRANIYLFPDAYLVLMLTFHAAALEDLYLV